jgi:hypothetical protein
MPTWREQLLKIFMEPKIRPWAILTPVLVLIVVLPLLQPLISPQTASHSERLMIDTARAIAEGKGLTLDSSWTGKPGTIDVNGRTVSSAPPAYAVLLAGPMWLMNYCGFTGPDDEAVVRYLLTLVGVAIPVAIGAGVVYRMGRLFELPRPQRAMLACLCVFGCGWISYATVLNNHAPAAAMLLCACACLLYVAAASKPRRVIWILLLGGMLAALAGAVDPWTLPIVLPLPLVVLAMQLPTSTRVIGLLLLTLGAAPIAWMHCAWSLSTFGTILPPSSTQMLMDMAGVGSDHSTLHRLGDLFSRLLTATLGKHGLFSHFPLLIVAIVGLVLVLRRHWPSHAKMLAAITFVGSIAVIMTASTRDRGFDGSQFAVQWFVVFSPLLMFWLGAVIRRDLHPRLKFAIALLAIFGITVSILGARTPLPSQRFTTHTALGAAQKWISTDTQPDPQPKTLLVSRK